MTVRILASHPDYEEFRQLQEKVCLITNPHMAGFSEEELDMPEAEILALKSTLLEKMENLISEYVELSTDIAGFILDLENGE
jgi:hypothetical protein